MTIEISAVQLQVMFDHATSVYPEECCGILLGKLAPAQKTVIEVIPTMNEWEALETAENHRTRNTRFTIPAKEIFLAQKRGRDLGLKIIGFFHSHPDYPAIPSECDRLQAWEIYSYPIISVIQGHAIDIQSWVLDSHLVFQPEVIKLTSCTNT